MLNVKSVVIWSIVPLSTASPFVFLVSVQLREFNLVVNSFSERFEILEDMGFDYGDDDYPEDPDQSRFSEKSNWSPMDEYVWFREYGIDEDEWDQLN